MDQGDGHQGSGRGAPNRSAVSSLSHRSPARVNARQERFVSPSVRSSSLTRSYRSVTRECSVSEA